MSDSQVIFEKSVKGGLKERVLPEPVYLYLEMEGEKKC